jgi:subtilisin family serine protease
MDGHGGHENRRGGKCLLALVLALAALGMSAPVALGLTPNDPSFERQWADSNTGQLVPIQDAGENIVGEARGTPGADVGALHAWQWVSTGSRSVVIGEVDTGVDYSHPDLAANIWNNPEGIAGCDVGARGYSVLTGTCEPMDEDTAYDGHGTHVAGIMGAVGNNEIGVAGINWQTTILPVKWLKSAGSQTESTKEQTEHLSQALRWLVSAKRAGANVRVVNDSISFEGTPYSSELEAAIEELGANNILFVTAAGNAGKDNDDPTVKRYPCKYGLANEICVTATDDKGQLPVWANHGAHTVDLAAPGEAIYSTLREATYGYLSGTSMASAQVAGAAALVLSVEPWLTAAEVKADILNSARPEPWLSGRVATGAILDVCKALPGCKPIAPTGAESPPAPNIVAPGTPAAPTTQPSVLAISGSVITVRHGNARIRLRCQGPETCSAELRLSVKRTHRAHTGSIEVIALARVSVPGNQAVTVTVKLNRNGRARLRAANGRLSAYLVIRGLLIPTAAQANRVRLLLR